MIDEKVKKLVRARVQPGNPFALDELLAKLGLDDQDRAAIVEIMADEYERRLRAMPREQMLEFYRLFYENTSDANKDWLLGEIVESIEAERS